MDRTFHRKLSAESIAAIVLLGGVALFCFWQRTTGMAIAGALVMAVDVMAIERMIHTTYVFTGNMLVVSKGRFAKTLNIAVNDIVKTEIVPTPLRTSHYVFLQVGANRHLALQPDNENAFIGEIRKRQRPYEKDL